MLRAGGALLTDPHPSVQCHNALRVGQQRVDVQLRQAWHQGQQFRQAGQHPHHGVQVDRRHIAPTGQQARNARARDQGPSQRRVQGRQGQGPVGHHLHRRSPLPEQDDRAKQRVDTGTNDQFHGLRTADHRLHREAFDARTGLGQRDTLQHQGGRLVDGLGILQAQGHAPDIRLVGDVVGQDLEGHRKTDALRANGRCVRVGANHAGLGHRDPDGRQQGFGFGLREPFAPGGQHAVDDGLGRRDIQSLRLARRRRLHELRLISAIGQDHRKGAHRLLGCVVGGNPCRVKTASGIFNGWATEPATEHPPRRGLNHRQQALCNVQAGHDGCGRMQKKQRAAGWLIQQGLERLHVPACRRIPDDVHWVSMTPIGGQAGIQALDGVRRQGRQLDAGGRRRVGAHHPRATTIGHDGDPISIRMIHAPRQLTNVSQRFSRHEQVGQRIHAKQPGAAKGCVVDQVRSRQRAGVRGCCSLTGSRTAGLDDQHRLVARGRPGS